MTVIKAFKAFRPTTELAPQVAAHPYDVLNRKEAKEQGSQNSFLHISRAEIDLPDTITDYDPQVYQQAKQNFDTFVAKGILQQDATDCLYLYAQTMNGRQQIGIVALTSTEDYENDTIKKHEFTRYEKELDRITHMQTTRLHSEPVFMAYRQVPAIDQLLAPIIAQTPLSNFTTPDGIGHTVWLINQAPLIEQLTALFAQQVPAIYIADGHHRAASSAKVAAAQALANPTHNGTEAYNYFLSVLFPDNQLAIMDYNRVITDLNGLTTEAFFDQLAQHFIIELAPDLWKPNQIHTFSLYINTQWYKLTALPHTYNNAHPIDGLDVTVLSNYVLAPILGIADQRKDKRIDFVGGIRGLQELKKRVDSGEMRLAIAFYPVSIAQLLQVADTGQVMPPKSTWFEPKLRSGLFVHQF